MNKKAPEFVKFSTIKNYIKYEQDLRSSNNAIEHLTGTLSGITLEILRAAKKYSLADKRKTTMLDDIKKAMETVIGKRHLDWEDVFEQIKKLPPAGIANLTAAMEDFIREEE